MRTITLVGLASFGLCPLFSFADVNVNSVSHAGFVRIDNCIGFQAGDGYNSSLLDFEENITAERFGSISIAAQSTASNERVIRSGSGNSSGGGGGSCAEGVFGGDGSEIRFEISESPTHFSFDGFFSGSEFTTLSVQLYELGGEAIFIDDGNNLEFDGTGVFSGDLPPGVYILELESSIGVGGGHPEPIEGASYDFFLELSFAPFVTECADGIDNDDDGLVDFPEDPGCVDAADDDEFNPPAQCADGIDNDDDGLVDFPEDPGCVDAADDDEFNPPAHCADGIDNDDDGLIDFPEDPGCVDVADDDEFNPPAQCADGIDNDDDGLIDFPEDPGCVDAADDDEFNPPAQCADGIDNDDDGLVDFPGDPGCMNPNDGDETDPLPFGENFISGQLSWRSDGHSMSVRFLSRALWHRAASDADAYQCLEPETLDPTSCGGDGLPGKNDLFMDIENCPMLDVGDGNLLGSPTSDGCLVYRVVNPAERGTLMIGHLIDTSKLPDIEIGMNHEYGASGIYEATIDSCCRIDTPPQIFSDADRHINNPGTPYRLRAIVDIGVSNSSPSSAAPRFVTCPIDGICRFEVHAIDEQTDVSFRLASPNEASPDGSFFQPSGASIDPYTGEYFWDTRGLPIADPNERHNYSTQVVMSDGIAESMSEFWITLVPEDNSVPPRIGPPPPPPIEPPPGEDPPVEPPEDFPPACGTSRIYRRGGMYHFKVSASDPDTGDIVTLDVSDLPFGAEMEPELPITGNPVTSELSWVPLITGKYFLNFHAVSSGRLTVQCPVEIDVIDVVAPDFELVRARIFGEGTTRPAFFEFDLATAKIVNRGNVSARADVLFELFPIDGVGQRFRRQKKVRIEPSEEIIVSALTNNSWRIGRGTYQFRVTVDPKDRVVEIDEGNNLYERRDPINVGE